MTVLAPTGAFARLAAPRAAETDRTDDVNADPPPPVGNCDCPEILLLFPKEAYTMDSTAERATVIAEL